MYIFKGNPIMEIIIGLVILVGVLYWFFIRTPNQDTVVSTPAPTPAKEEELSPKTTAWHTAPPEGTQPTHIQNPLDINHDGKVTLDDVKEAVKKVRKPRAPKAEAPVAKPAAKKAAPAKKAAVKKPATRTVKSKKV
jgi:hypothetical protein